MFYINNIFANTFRGKRHSCKIKEVPYSVKIAKFLTIYTRHSQPAISKWVVCLRVYMGVWRYLTECGQQPTSFVLRASYLVA